MISSEKDDDFEYHNLNKNKYSTKEQFLIRYIGINKQKELYLMSDSEKYEIVKYQLQLITKGERKSQDGEVEYLKNLLKELKRK